VVGTLLDENVARKLNELTIPKLCIRLNTLQVSIFFNLLWSNILFFYCFACLVEVVHMTISSLFSFDIETKETFWRLRIDIQETDVLKPYGIHA